MSKSVAKRLVAQGATVLYVCRSCGYSPTNRADWCDKGCGSDYNQMHAVPLPSPDNGRALAASLLLDRLDRIETALRQTRMRLDHDEVPGTFTVAHHENCPKSRASDGCQRQPCASPCGLQDYIDALKDAEHDAEQLKAQLKRLEAGR